MNYNLNIYFNLYIGFLLFLMLSQNVLAQSQHKNIYTSDLDSLWSRNTYIKAMSNNGKWIASMEEFAQQENNVWLMQTGDTNKYKLPNCQWISFSKNNRWFGCISLFNEFILFDLKKKTKRIYKDKESQHFSHSGNFVAAIQKTSDGEKSLWLMNLGNDEEYLIKNAIRCVWHPFKNKLLVIIKEENQHKIIHIDAETLVQKVIHESQSNSFASSEWSSSGNVVISQEHGLEENFIHLYKANGTTTLGKQELNKNYPTAKLSLKKPHISNDGKKVIFYREENRESNVPVNSGVEIWESTTPWIGLKMNEYEVNELTMLATVWYPETGEIIAIETKETPSSALDINHQYGLVYNQLEYEPLYKEYYNTDLYAINMETGKKDLIVQNQYIGPGFVTISPKGKYVAYFKNKHWWVYNTTTKKTTIPTKDMNEKLENDERNLAGDIAPYGNPGWSLNDEYILIYDQYDIWLINSDGSYKKRITKGREEKIRYKINKDYRRNNYYYLTLNINFSSSPFNLEEGIILEMYNNMHQSGYAFWNKKKGSKILLFEERKIGDILASDDFYNIVYTKQKFNEPHSIYNLNLKNNKQDLIYQSNKELLNYDLGRAEKVNYVLNGEELSGTLFYPAHFNPQKKYPMIVFIYEKVSNNLNLFTPPSFFEYIGFSKLKYTTNDYFVFYPDIKYTVGNPGISALNWVTAAVSKVLEKDYIEPSKIGLFGHSFGGYEAAFIATQSNKFSAIVVGAGVTNFSSHYHGIGWNWKKPEIWRYESQQWRMGESFYENREAYLQNSPMHHVHNVSVPVLFWTGREDFQVHWMQSIEMYLALKRQGKISKLLLIENEKHVVKNPKKQNILTKQIWDWFNKYCK